MANFAVTPTDTTIVVQVGENTVAAAASATLSQAWAEGTLPGGPGTKSAREHSQDAAASADNADNSANVASQARDVAIAAGVQYPSEAAAVAALADGAFGSYLDPLGNPVWGQRTGGTMTPLPGPWLGGERIASDDGASGALWTTVAGFIARLRSSAGSTIVGFIASGIGAIVRSVQERLRDTLSVKDFGAVGDGVTDDTLSIKKAFSALTPNSSLKFPAGHYVISDSIATDLNDVTIYGKSALIEQVGSFKQTFRFSNAKRISVRGLRFLGKGTEHNGASTSYNGVAAIYFKDGEDCIVSNCLIARHAGGGIRHENTKGLIISNCVIAGIGAIGGINALDSNADAAISGLNDSNINMTNCIIRDHCFAVLSSTGSGGLTIANCTIGPIPGQHGVYGAATSGMTITGSLFQDIVGEAIKNQIAALNDLATEDMTVSGNTFRNIGQSCVAINRVGGASVGRFKNINVVGNTATNIGNYFCTFRVCDGGNIVSNSIYDCDSCPIDLQDFQGRIVNNEIKNASWYGIYLDANGDCEISNNTIEDAAQNFTNDATANVRYQTMVFVTSSFGSGKKIILKQNTFKRTPGALPAQLTRSIRTTGNVDIYFDGGHNFSQLPVELLSVKSFDIGYSLGVDTTVTAMLNPTIPIYGRGRRELYGTQDPATSGMTDTFRQGDVCWSATPTAGGTVGWVCVTSGAPGTWRAFGTIAT